MIVREVLPAELAAVGELRVQAYRERNLLSASPAYADTLRTLGADGHGEVLVAVEDGRVLGTVMLDPWHEGSEIALGPEEAEIRALAVAAEAGGRGIGTALVRAVVDRAVAHGVRHLVLSTQPAMPPEAQTVPAAPAPYPRSGCTGPRGSPGLPSATGRPFPASPCSRSAGYSPPEAAAPRV